MSGRSRIEALVKAISRKTGMIFKDLTSAVQELAEGYTDAVSASSAINDGKCQSGCRLTALLRFINKVTGTNHPDITRGVQTLVDGYGTEPSVFLYSFGAVSDTHIQYGPTPDGGYDGVEDLKRALSYFDDKVDFICVCGDLISDARPEYMAQYKSIVTDPTLTTKPIYESAGNHETYPAQGVAGEIDKAVWEDTTGWANHLANGCVGDSLYYYFTKGDDIFIMLSLVNAAKKEGSGQYGAFADGALDWLEDLLEANQNKRCFVFQHVNDRNDIAADPSRGYSDMLDGSDGVRFVGLMKQYKNAVWFHGHTHLSIAWGLDAAGYKIANDDYTPISTALGYKSVHIPSLQGVRFYNPTTNGVITSYKFYGSDGETYEASGGQYSEGYIVDVYNNKIVVRGIDFAVLKYTPSWEAYYEVAPMENKVFTLNTRLRARQ